MAQLRSVRQTILFFTETTLHFGFGGYSGPVNIEIFWAGPLVQRVTPFQVLISLAAQFSSSHLPTR